MTEVEMPSDNGTELFTEELSDEALDRGNDGRSICAGCAPSPYF